MIAGIGVMIGIAVIHVMTDLSKMLKPTQLDIRKAKAAVTPHTNRTKHRRCLCRKSALHVRQTDGKVAAARGKCTQ